MKIHFLGTNGWYDTETGNTVCVLLDAPDAYIVFDAGGGFYKIDRYIKDNKPVYLFISHYHLDHIIGLHALNKFNFRQGIDIFGPPGLKNLFKDVINKNYSMPLVRLKTKIRLHEIKKGSFLPKAAQYKVLKHSVSCYGYRFSCEGRIIAYCTDTGLCPNIFSLAEEADILMAECALKPGEINQKWPHLNPAQAAAIALKAKAKKLILLHFDAYAYPNMQKREAAGNIARKIFKNTIAATDGLKIDL